MSDAPFRPTERILMGPGPSPVPDRVRLAMAAPVLGHLDPEFLELMDRIQAQLRAVFRTKNRLTLPMSGTGSAGMETCFVDLLEKGDRAVIGVNGVFGTRMADVAERCGASVMKVEAPWGEIVPADRMAEAIAAMNPKVVGLVHAETSTGVLQPVEEIASITRDAGAILILDCVTSLGGHPVEIDAWGVDAAYAGTQKCLNAPPGLAPVTLSGRALDVIDERRSKVASWYLDLSMIANYWSEGARAYHHTAPISMNYALHEALNIVLEEGLDARFARHERHHRALAAGLDGLGLELAAQEGHRLWTLNAVAVPEGVDEAAIRSGLLAHYDLEIGAGLGPMKGKVWRVGLMGASADRHHVLLFLAALESLLDRSGGVAGAVAAYGSA